MKWVKTGRAVSSESVVGTIVGDFVGTPFVEVEGTSWGQRKCDGQITLNVEKDLRVDILLI